MFVLFTYYNYTVKRVGGGSARTFTLTKHTAVQESKFQNVKNIANQYCTLCQIFYRFFSECIENMTKILRKY